MRTVKETTKTENKEVVNEFKLTEAFVLWLNQSKAGNTYYKGYDLHKNKLVAYPNTNKKNPKEPDVRVYLINAEGNQDKEVASLWDNISKNNKQFLSGTTDENEKLVGFYGDKTNQDRPYIRVYFKEN